MTPSTIAARKIGDSRNANAVFSKSTPASARPSAPAASVGRKGRMPVADPRPAAWSMSRR